eukprot:m.9750 g.9750  ORF g.9750 m.9750 type:complete len:385 (+) comp5810_c0_seq1:290-1444(+)
MPKETTIEVEHVEGKDVFDITSKTTGHDLLVQVMSHLNAPPMPYFNLQYIDNKDYEAFVKPEKKILSHDLKKEKDQPYRFTLLAQFFPELVSEELADERVQRLLWLQIRDSIVKDTCYCPPELCVLFAAESMQALHGDFDSDRHNEVIDATKELPERVLKQHDLTPEQWAERIKNAWITLKGISPAQVVMDYLNVAQDLEQYGVTYFEIHNKKGTKLWLGVHNLGMDIYEYRNKVTPRLGFPWTEISNISFNDKKFTIKMIGGKAPDFKFYSPRFKLNKRILDLCVQNHKMYVERRKKQMLGEGMAEDRAAFEAKIKRTREHLTAIRRDLESVKDKSRETAEDRLYEQQKEAGMDKYKTMKKAQSGDARKRVEDFENLEDTAEC